MSGLVMLQPHGFEGQGPEHSSARIERFLQLCAEDNLQVANCTTPAQYFHLLRRQMRRPWRSPLVVFTPKSLLRHKRAVSRPRELAVGRFHEVVDDPQAAAAPADVARVVLCSGKVYYDALEERERRLGDRAGRAALVRVEQLYPWPQAEIAAVVERYARAERVVWCQEEPSNMGAWIFVRDRIQDALRPGQKLAYAGRPESASPATGSGRIHREEQAAVLAAALDGVSG
jgi:2-oxoglutarate dehydrogenase E1 component